MSLHAPIRWDDRPTSEERWRAECERRVDRLAWLSESEERLGQDREYCSRGVNGLIHWIENYCWMIDPDATKKPHERLVPVVLWDSQRELIHWLYGRIADGHTAALIPKTRKLGVTWLVLLTCLWFCTFSDKFSALLGSRKEQLVDGTGSDATLFGKVRSAIKLLPPHVSPVVDVDRHMFIRFDNGSQMLGEATGLDFGRSGRSSVTFLDEFAATAANMAERTWMSIESVAKTVVAVWNPGPEDHITYKLHQGDANERAQPDAIRFLDWRFAPHRDDAWWESHLVENGGRLTVAQRDSIYGGKYGFVQSGLIWRVDKETVQVDYGQDRIDELRNLCYHVGGWDYGSGGSFTANPGGPLELDLPGNQWVLHIVDDLVWSRVIWEQIVRDANGYLSLHPLGVHHWGDPAGDSVESTQTSWASNLRGGIPWEEGQIGIPIETLPGADNRAGPFEQAIQRLQIWMDRGNLKVHKRCDRMWRCLNNWTWNTDPENPTKAIVKPDHGEHSHIGMALLYLSMGLERWLAGRFVDDAPGEARKAAVISSPVSNALDGSSYRL